MAQNFSDRLARSKVGSIFFKQEEDFSEPEERPQDARPARQVAPAPAVFGAGNGVGTVPVSSVPSYSISQNVDPETRAKLQSIADSTDQVSYTRFRQLVESMKVNFADEATCYKAAFTAGKAFNMPVSEVLRGVDAILHELSETERKFNDAAAQRLAEKVGKRRERISQLQQSVAERNAQLQRLQQEISHLNQELQSEHAAITQDEQGVREDTAKFGPALEAVRAPYASERQKIELYGKGA
jgi:hypothetical protein